MSRPHDNDEMYSTIVLGTMRSPGVVKLSGHDRDKAWDVKPAKGQTGASSALNGDPIGSFDATFYLADDGAFDERVGGADGFTILGVTDFDRWDDFQRLIESTTNGPTPVALPIYHPDLAAQRYTEVVSGGVGGMVHDGRGGASIKVKFLEYRPPKPKPIAKAKPKPGAPGATSTIGKPPKPDPNAAAKRELAALLERARQP
jgi:hypothetical protein